MNIPAITLIYKEMVLIRKDISVITFPQTYIRYKKRKACECYIFANLRSLTLINKDSY